MVDIRLLTYDAAREHYTMRATTALTECLAKWRWLWLDPLWTIEVRWTDALGASAQLTCQWELWYALIEVDSALDSLLVERAILHELLELELYELGEQFAGVVDALPDITRQEYERARHRELRNRTVERRVRTLLPSTGLPQEAGIVWQEHPVLAQARAVLAALGVN